MDRIKTQDVSRGWASVDVMIDRAQGHGIYMIKMAAGSVGMEFGNSGHHGERMDTVGALSG
jgi:hypothetical protein